MKISLLSARVHYGPETVLHTASSGAIGGLDELYLTIERDGRLLGLGEVRENIGYLTGLEPAEARAAVIGLLERQDWRLAPDQGLAALHDPTNRSAKRAPAIAKALIDCTLHDRKARADGQPLAEALGGAFRPSLATNQSLFWSSDEMLLARAERYIARGFRDLKLRLGAADLERDLHRVRLLRETFGREIALAGDANGAWSPDQARAALAGLAEFRLGYLEQPIAAGDWAAMAALARDSPIPIMLDESLRGPEDTDRVIALDGRVWAHLKIVKLGGITPLIAAGRKLRSAGVPFMVGQMNEGAAATAAACHCAMALEPEHAELYGADGLLDDPATDLAYHGGCVRLEEGPGLGVTLERSGLPVLWQTVSA